MFTSLGKSILAISTTVIFVSLAAVMEFLSSLSPKMRAKAYSEIELLQEHGIYLKEPYVKPIKGEQYKEIYELRIKLGSDASRIFYFTYHIELR